MCAWARRARGGGGPSSVLAPLLAPGLPGQSGSRTSEEAPEPRERSVISGGYARLPSFDLPESVSSSGLERLSSVYGPSLGTVQLCPPQAWGHILCTCSNCRPPRPVRELEGGLSERPPCATSRAGRSGLLDLSSATPPRAAYCHLPSRGHSGVRVVVPLPRSHS